MMWAAFFFCSVFITNRLSKIKKITFFESGILCILFWNSINNKKRRSFSKLKKIWFFIHRQALENQIDPYTYEEALRKKEERDEELRNEAELENEEDKFCL